MTDKQIELVQTTWEKCIPIADTAADLFYGKLFELDPSLKSMFSSDMKEQGRKLMMMINTAVKGLSNLPSIVGAVQNLGRGHVKYGVKEEHYETVGAALIWTLSQGLGDAFTDEVEEAWVATYTLLSTTMKEAASESAA